ncbi:MAG: endolytic transglycosylase MltG [Polyangiales bacterium]
MTKAAPKSRRRKSRAPSPPASSARGRVAILVAVFLSIVVLVLLALPYRRHPGVGRAVDVEIAPGASEAETVARLEAAGVIDGGLVFSFYVRTRGGLMAKPGRHLLSDDLSIVEVVRRLRRSPEAAKVRVTFPEGWNRFDIARRLRDKRVCDDRAFLTATVDKSLLDELAIPYDSVPTAEGWLFPATYDLPADAEPAEVVRRMVSETKDRIKKLGDGKQAPLDVRQTMVLASIVEKEAVVDDERPIIASVFLNRLRDPSQTGGRLEADPTAMYGCWTGAPPTPTCVTWLALGTTKPSAAIEHDELNAWSTYTHAGLPPTPIANPSEKSMAAAFAPATTKYFYFVAKGGGRHTFSETLAAHQKATH